MCSLFYQKAHKPYVDKVYLLLLSIYLCVPALIIRNGKKQKLFLVKGDGSFNGILVVVRDVEGIFP